MEKFNSNIGFWRTSTDLNPLAIFIFIIKSLFEQDLKTGTQRLTAGPVF